MAQFSPYVLKVRLHTSQPTNQPSWRQGTSKDKVALINSIKEHARKTNAKKDRQEMERVYSDSPGACTGLTFRQPESITLQLLRVDSWVMW